MKVFDAEVVVRSVELAPHPGRRWGYGADRIKVAFPDSGRMVVVSEGQTVVPYTAPWGAVTLLVGLQIVVWEIPLTVEWDFGPDLQRRLEPEQQIHLALPLIVTCPGPGPTVV